MGVWGGGELFLGNNVPDKCGWVGGWLRQEGRRGTRRRRKVSSYSGAHALHEKDPERDRATQVTEEGRNRRRVLLSVRIEDAANEKSYRRLADFEHGNGKIAPVQSNLCHAQLPGRLLNKIKRLMMCHMTGDTQ